MRTVAPLASTPQPTPPAKFPLFGRRSLGESLEAIPILRVQHTSGSRAARGHDYSRIPIGPPSPGVLQRTLAISSHDDIYEQEADSVAERVLRMPEARTQRKCRECEAEDRISSGTMRRVAATPSPSVRRRATEADASGDAPPIVNDVISGAGRSLDPGTRSFMESRFRHDFSDVRIHTGSRAAESARAVNAVAYTVGPHVVFEEGAYRPETDAGRRLIAHELTHVIQQGIGDSSIRPESENEFGDNTILNADREVHRYRSSNRRVQRQEACYCCISSVAISNVSRIDTATRMGHSFDFEIRTSRSTQHGPRLGPECTLEWWERTNVPYTSGMTANTWTDMFRLVPTSPTFNPWNNRPTACDTASTVTINDPPTLGRRPGRTVTRTLEFDLKVKSGPGGTCANAEQSATATQVLSMVNGAPDWASSSFT